MRTRFFPTRPASGNTKKAGYALQCILILGLSLLSLGCKGQPDKLHGVWIKTWEVESYFPTSSPTTTAAVVYEFKPDGTGRRFDYAYTVNSGPHGAPSFAPRVDETMPINWEASRNTIFVEIPKYEGNREYFYRHVSDGSLSAEEDGITDTLRWEKLELNFDEARRSIEKGNFYPFPPRLK